MANSVKTDELDQWHEYDIYTPARLINLSGDINKKNASQFIKNIRLLDYVTDKDITVLISTSGGSVVHGMEIFDAIKECNSKVITHAVGPCWSMGSIILQAGDERIISTNASIMIHIGSEGYDDDHPENIKRWMKENERLDKITNEVLFKKIKEKKPRFKMERLQNMLMFDTIFTADKALEYGLVDRIAAHKSF